MYLGKNSLRYDYKTGNSHSLEKTECERDLGILLCTDLKFSQHVASVTSKANGMFGLLKHTFVSRDMDLWTRLNKTYIRPHLEFAVTVWRPYI